MISDKMQILSKLSDEAQELFDSEVKKAFERGQAQVAYEATATKQRWDGVKGVLSSTLNALLVLLFGFVVATVFTYGEIVRQHYFPPAAPQAEIKQNLELNWYPIAVDSNGDKIFAMDIDETVRCYSYDHHRHIGCVNISPRAVSPETNQSGSLSP